MAVPGFLTHQDPSIPNGKTARRRSRKDINGSLDAAFKPYVCFSQNRASLNILSVRSLLKCHESTSQVTRDRLNFSRVLYLDVQSMRVYRH